MVKRFSGLLLSLALLIGLLVPLSSVSAYTDGLLDGKELSVGKNYLGASTFDETSKSTVLTDNDESTFVTLATSWTDTRSDGVKYSFSSPMNINSYYVKATGATERLVIYFFDSTEQPIGTYIYPPVIGAKTNVEFNNVKSVIILGGASGQVQQVQEFDVFGTPATGGPIDPEEPEPNSSSERALLTIYITGGQIKEYDLSATELTAFIAWYDAKDAGSGPAKYKFVKTWNKGPFKARSEYVIFDKILAFDVDEYNVTP